MAALPPNFGTDVVDGAFFAGIAIAVFDVADVFAVELDLADFDVSAFAGLDEGQEIDGTVFGIAVKFQINGQVAVGSRFDFELCRELRHIGAEAVFDDGPTLSGFRRR